MNLRNLRCTILLILVCCSATLASAEPKLTLHLPFDGSVEPTIAASGPQEKLLTRPAEAKFAGGIARQGLVTGASQQGVVLDAKGNISPEQWTITFWTKGLDNAAWNEGKFLETFWQLDGDKGGMMWFYHYMNHPTPWLYSRPDDTKDYLLMYVPYVPEKEWHYWAVSWHKGSNAYLYLDGRLVGQSPCQPPENVRSITVGQPENPMSPPESNKIIDEFKIYDTALDAGAITRQYWREGDMALRPNLTVSPARQKITVDGKIDPQEWQQAAGFTGLINAQSWNIEAPRTWGKIAYDDQNLYLALHSDNPAEVKENPDAVILHGFVKKAAVRHDDAVQQDDNFLVQIAPAQNEDKLYTIQANGIDTVYDAVSDAAGKTDAAWNSGAVVKSNIGMAGWSFEAAIPLKSLGVDSISNGTLWRMNFGRVWKQLRQRTDLWAAGRRVDDATTNPAAGLGTVAFSAAPGPVVDMQKFEITSSGQVNTTLNVFNPKTVEQELSVVLTAAKKPLQDQKVKLKPNESRKIELSAQVQDADGALIDTAVLDGSKVLLNQSAPLIIERVGQLALWQYPSTQQIRLGWIIPSASKAAEFSLEAEVKDAIGKVVRTAKLEHLPELIGSTMLDVKTLPLGPYSVDMRVLKDKAVVQQQTLAYHHQALPAWLGNKLGISDTPPPPWTNVAVAKDKDTVSIWGRTYKYEKQLFPAQIINQGKPMLARSIRLVWQGADGVSNSSSAAKANAQWPSVKAVRADTKRNQTIGPVNVQSNSYTEFDGMTWTELAVTPQAGPAKVKGLAIEIPLKPEWAELIRPYNDHILQQTGLLPKNGWKGKASTFSMPWVGNGDGGIQFFQESTASWIGSKSVEVVPDGKGAVVLRVHLIDEPATLDKPLKFAFGWMVSPVKAPHTNHRNWRLFASNSEPYVKAAVKGNPAIKPIFPWWNDWWWWPEPFEGNPDHTGAVPVPKPTIGAKAGVSDYHGFTTWWAAYTRLTGLVGTANPWFEQFGDEWAPTAEKYAVDKSLPLAKQSTTVSQASSSLRDFYLWGMNDLLERTQTKAFYYDVSRPVEDTNIYRDAKTHAPRGPVEPKLNILGMRKTFQRLYTLLKQKHPDGIVFYHMSGEILLPIDSFCDTMIDGENYDILLDRKNNRGYENTLSLDQFRTEYSAQNNFGPSTTFLPDFERAGSIRPDEWKTLGMGHADYIIGLVLMHDSNLWWDLMPVDQISKVYGILDNTGLNATWKYTPYWRQKDFALPKGINASIYRSPDGKKDVVVVMNTSGKDQPVDLALPAARKGRAVVKTIYSAQAVSGKAVTIANNGFAIMLVESK